MQTELLGLFYILHHSWFPRPALCHAHAAAAAEPSCGIFPQHRDRLAAVRVILRYSQRNKPSQDRQEVPVWGGERHMGLTFPLRTP